MYSIKIQQNEVDEVVAKFASSGTFLRTDGMQASLVNRLSGIIGERFACKLAGKSTSEHKGEDNGYDIKLGEHLIDVKTTSVNGTKIQPDFNGLVANMYIKSSATGFLFLAFDRWDNTITVCGMCGKEYLMNVGTFIKAGERYPVGNGKALKSCWHIPYNNTKHINSEQDLKGIFNLMESGKEIPFYN